MKSRTFLRFLSLVSCYVLMLALFSCKTTVEFFGEGCYIVENHTDLKDYFVKIDSVGELGVNGRVYLVDDNLTMQARSFLLRPKWNRHEVVLSDTIFCVFKMKKIDDCRMEGHYIESLRKNKFFVYPYKMDECQDFDIGRYRDGLFEVEKISDVNYAKAKGYWTSVPDDAVDMVSIIRMGVSNSLKKRDLDLDMDIYIPKNDTLEKRPLIMFIHGGAFYVGDKAVNPYREWCTYFASLGYVCASINYRMGFLPNSKAIQRTAYQATQDAHAAMRYLLSKRDVYRIDPDCLFVGGSSAGGITALNLAYMRNKNRPESSFSSLFFEDLGNIESSGNSLKENFEVKAVANMWGAVYDLDILKNTKTSIISFHGNKDEIVPYGAGYPFAVLGDFKKVFFDEMYGSCAIDKKAKELGLRSKLHTFCGEGHSLHLDEDRNLNDNFYIIQNEIADFFYEEMNPHTVAITQDEYDCQIFTIDTTDVATFDWNVVGGVLLEDWGSVVRAVWFDDDLYHELRVSGCYKNGVGFEDIFVIKNVK